MTELGPITEYIDERPDAEMLRDILSRGTPKGGRPPKYAWAKWDDGEWHIIRKGRDFGVSTHAMQMQVHRYASSRGKVAYTRTLGGEALMVGIFDDYAAKKAKLTSPDDYNDEG